MCASGIAIWLLNDHSLCNPSTSKTARSPLMLTSTIAASGFDFDQLDRDAIGPFDHRRPRGAPRVNLLEELDVLALQPRDGGVKVRRAQRPVVVDLAARTDEAAARPRPDRDRDVVEVDAAGRDADEAGLRERRPRRWRVGLGVA